MSNATRKHSRGLFLPPNRKQRKLAHKFSKLTQKIREFVNLLTDKSNAISQQANNE